MEDGTIVCYIAALVEVSEHCSSVVEISGLKFILPQFVIMPSVDKSLSNLNRIMKGAPFVPPVFWSNHNFSFMVRQP